jgi:hypothetical protein
MWGGVLLGKDRRRRRWISGGAWDGEKNEGDGEGAVAKGTTHRAETDPRWREAEAETEGRMAAARKER